MGLRRAIELLPCDRGTEATLRDIVLFFKLHTGEWYESARVSALCGVPGDQADHVLSILCETFVLDCSGTPIRYRLESDRVTQFEIDGFLKRADRHSGALQSNVERFRGRYGR